MPQNLRNLLSLSLFFSTLIVTVMTSQKTNLEADLINHLLKNHSSLARPVLDPNSSLTVELSLQIQRLEELNTKSQYIAVLGYIEIWWTDETLNWDPNAYGGIQKIVVFPKDVWVPSLLLANNAAEHLYDEMWYKLFKIVVSDKGRMYWAPGGIFKAQCSIDVWLFPFDDQICLFWFTNWIYTEEGVNITSTVNAEKDLLKLYNHNNGQWDILKVGVIRSEKYYSFGSPYPEVIFGLHLKRKPLFYVTNIILLTVLLAVLVILMFKLPIESGERVSMGVTLLLSFSIFILMIDTMIPETSSTVPIITLYLVCFMTLTGLGICETVFVLSCFHHDGRTGPPEWMNKLLNDPGNKSKSSLEGNCFKYVSKEDNSFDLVQVNKCRWQHLARMIDRLSFWVALLLFVLLMVILLVIIPYTSKNKYLDSQMTRDQLYL